MDRDNELIWECYLLKEMIVVGDKRTPSGKKYFVSYERYIWIFETEKFTTPNDEMNLNRMIINIPIEGFNSKFWDSNVSDIHDMRNVEEHNNDIIYGEFDGNEGKIYNKYLSTQTSIHIKKLKKSLGLKFLTVPDGDYDEEAYMSSMSVDLPEWGYHGTSVKYLESIFRFGIKPVKGVTNYENISHDDKIFFTTKFTQAISHAQHTAHITGSDKAVIIKMRIPDPELIVPDYDMDVSSRKSSDESSIYKHIRSGLKYKGDQTSDYSPIRLSKEYGLFGYKGRIPASNIWEVYISHEGTDMLNDDLSRSDFMSLDKDYFKQLKELVGGYGDWVDYVGMSLFDVSYMIGRKEDEEDEEEY